MPREFEKVDGEVTFISQSEQINEDEATIKISKLRVDIDPLVIVWQVEVSTGDACWMESFGSDNETIAFLKGLQAGYSMSSNKYLSIPGLPR